MAGSASSRCTIELSRIHLGGLELEQSAHQVWMMQFSEKVIIINNQKRFMYHRHNYYDKVQAYGHTAIAKRPNHKFVGSYEPETYMVGKRSSRATNEASRLHLGGLELEKSAHQVWMTQFSEKVEKFCDFTFLRFSYCALYKT